MLDKVSIKCGDYETIKHLTESYFLEQSVSFVKVYGQLNTYKLYNNLVGIEKHHLKIVMNYETWTLKIIGSFRKWFYGATSLNDFTKAELLEALEILSLYLDISIGKIFSFELSSIEVGLNVPVTCGEKFLFSKAVKYKNDSRYEKEPHGNSVTFETDYESIILYGKIEQIISETRKKRKNQTDKSYLHKLEHTSKNLRVEIKYKGGKSRIETKLGVKTIGDFYLNYIRILNVFWRSVNTLEFYNQGVDELHFNPQKKSIKELTEYLILHSLNSLGIEEIERLISQLEPNARRQARRSMKNKFEFLSNEKQVNVKKELMKNIRRELTMTLFRNKMLKQAKRVFTINNSIQ